jgi:hypothetical protein
VLLALVLPPAPPLPVALLLVVSAPPAPPLPVALLLLVPPPIPPLPVLLLVLLPALPLVVPALVAPEPVLPVVLVGSSPPHAATAAEPTKSQDLQRVRTIEASCEGLYRRREVTTILAHESSRRAPLTPPARRACAGA